MRDDLICLEELEIWNDGEIPQFAGNISGH